MHAFFSTVTQTLEPRGWGSRFPMLLGKLCEGALTQADAGAALRELDEVETGLAQLVPDQVVWDAEDLTRSLPWGNRISPGITSLANYFITSTGRPFIPLLRECLQELRDEGGVLEIVSY